jgi:hypothetical protein
LRRLRCLFTLVDTGTWLTCSSTSQAPTANDISIHDNPVLEPLFLRAVPDSVPGFECTDREVMELVWPEGTENALAVLPVSPPTRSGR